MGKSKLLFVDDEENVIKALKRLFHDEDCEFITARSGDEGLRALENNSFHVVVADYRMPGINGIEFLKHVKEKSPDTVRVILTGNADVENILSAINEGHVYKFLTKPWQPEEFKLMIKNAMEYHDLLLERQRLNQEVLCQNSKLEQINRNLEKLVEERTKQLLNSERMAVLGQMAGQIGHEIRNILTILKGHLQLAEAEIQENEKICRSLKKVSEAYDRLEIQSRNLLTLGKPTPVSFTKVNLKKVVNKTVETLVETGILKYYKIIKDYTPDSVFIYGDANQLEQVFTNILINSHHAMECSGTVTIAVMNNSETGMAEVHIIDTGHGIPEENLGKIFEPFFTTKPEGKGTGLGLLVVKKITETHKGYIRVESKINTGTKMIFGFPVL